MSSRPIAGMGMLDLADEVKRLRERVATLEGGIRVHKAGTDDCGDADCGCVTSSDRRLWSLLDASHDQERADD